MVALGALAIGACTLEPRITRNGPCAAGYRLEDGRCVPGAPGELDASVTAEDGGPDERLDAAPEDAGLDSTIVPLADGGPLAPPDRECAFAVRDPLAPVVFFTDLVSGPNEGGEQGLGVFVTLYGLRFGQARASSVVTYGGVEVARYVAWGQPTPVARGIEAVVVQIGGSLADGPHELVISVNGRSSNPLPFTLRRGDIFFVDPNRSIPGDGSTNAPWNSLYQARGIGTVNAGATIYVKARIGGRIETIDPLTTSGTNGVNLRFDANTATTGTPDAPIAYVGYPGSYPSIGGDPSYVEGGDPQRNGRSLRAIAFPESGPHVTDYVIANMTLGFTREHTLEMSGPGRRIVAVRHIDNLAQNQQVAGVGTRRAAVLGNYATDSTGDFIAFWSSPSQIDLGWNQVLGSRFQSAFHIGGFGGDDLVSDVAVHDNLVDSVGQAAFFFGHYDSIVDNVRVYNNVVRSSRLAALFLEQPTHRLGSIVITNNTFVRAGPIDYGTSVGDPHRWLFRNNIITVAQTTPEYYVPGATQGVTGDHNLYVGASGVTIVPDPTDRIVEDPRFVNPDGVDVRLMRGSPAIDTGVDTGRCSDFHGVARPQGAAYDRGAIESY